MLIIFTKIMSLIVFTKAHTMHKLIEKKLYHLSLDIELLFYSSFTKYF